MLFFVLHVFVLIVHLQCFAEAISGLDVAHYDIKLHPFNWKSLGSQLPILYLAFLVSFWPSSFSPSILQLELLRSRPPWVICLPWSLPFVGDIVQDSILEGGTKSEPTSPTSCSSQLPWQPIKDSDISVTFPDLKSVYQKTQSRANRQSRQRVENGKIKIRVYTAGPQVQSIEVYVERTPDAAVLVGDKCGRVSLKSQPGKYLPHQVMDTL